MSKLGRLSLCRRCFQLICKHLVYGCDLLLIFACLVLIVISSVVTLAASSAARLLVNPDHWLDHILSNVILVQLARMLVMPSFTVNPLVNATSCQPFLFQ